MTPQRWEHIQRVATLLDEWADIMDEPARERERWHRAAVLHDALKDAPVDRLRVLAPDAWDIDAIRHGPAAANLAAQLGEHDAGVLDAVRYHSVGYVGWERVGRMLYVADYLEPGRDFPSEERGRLAARVPDDPDTALCEVVAQRLAHLERRGVAPLPETVAFVDALACDGA